MRDLIKIIEAIDSVNLQLTMQELEALYHALAELAMNMDDDGREGAFDASPLRPIYNKILALLPRNRR